MPTLSWWSSRTGWPVRLAGSRPRTAHRRGSRHVGPPLQWFAWVRGYPPRRSVTLLYMNLLLAATHCHVGCGRDDAERALSRAEGRRCWPVPTRGTRSRFDDPPVPAIRMSDGPAGVRGTSWTGAASASFPCGAALGATWDPALVGEVGRALGPRGPLQERPGAARPDRQPAPHPDRRSQLRVLQRGPRAHGRAGRRLHRGRAVRAGRRVHQALRRQRHRVRADDDLLGDRRADAARAVPRCRSRLPSSGPACGP